MDRKGLYYSLVLAQTSQEFDSLDNPEYEGTFSKSLCFIVTVYYIKESLWCQTLQLNNIHFILNNINTDKNVEDGNANGETLDQVIDLSLPPLSSMVSSSTVLSVPAMSSSTMVNNFVNAGNNTGQSASITQVRGYVKWGLNHIPFV